MLQAVDKPRNTAFVAVQKAKLTAKSGLEQIMQQANRIEGQAARALGDDGLKVLIEAAKETSNEQTLVEDPHTFGLQLESLSQR